MYNAFYQQRRLLSAKFDMTCSSILFGYSSAIVKIMEFQAVIIYTADKSTDRTAIESALNDYFNIY
jgi:hypothetical protein